MVVALAAAALGRAGDETVAPAAGSGTLRELNTDRPDVTESPFTVDAGHTQLEMDLASVTRNQLDGVRTTEVSAGDFNLRFGITRSFELGLFLTPYLHRTETPRGGPSVTTSGVGDAVVRGKWNFWGDDGGTTAFGLIVDVLLPTAARGLGEPHAVPAMTLPLALDLGHGWDAGAMTTVEARPRDEGGYHGVWTNTLTLGRELAHGVAGYAEIASTVGDGSHVATFDVGVTWKLDANTQLDAGTNLGITRAADNLMVFAGVSRRF